MSRGVVFNIQRFSTSDGPGIRTTVFLKGCPLNCRWCHNPESLDPSPELLFNREKCVGCGACASVCPERAITIRDGKAEIDEAACVHCGRCAMECPMGALEMVGRERTAEEIVTIIEKDALFYKRSGGVTLSGGEPLSQPEFAADILRQCKERGIHTVVDTSGAVDWADFETVIPYVDLFLFDLKHTDEARHTEFTDASNTLILENLAKLVAAGSTVVGRYPVVPGVNADPETCEAIGNLAVANGLKTLHLLPYHAYGGGKSRRLIRSRDAMNYDSPAREDLDKMIGLLTNLGLNVIVGGES